MKLEYSSILRVRLRPETVEQLKVEARRRGTNVSALMRQFIETGLESSGPSNPAAGGTDGSAMIAKTPRPRQIPASEEREILQRYDELVADEEALWPSQTNDATHDRARSRLVSELLLKEVQGKKDDHAKRAAAKILFEAVDLVLKQHGRLTK
ncbi:MAG TPA: ribbon-helix-helix protein, CopG family [Thermoplasmata archaeon]|nr:ribbon-helix-helix protein, CopG family [Thermoplasmata archaeon]